MGTQRQAPHHRGTRDLRYARRGWNAERQIAFVNAIYRDRGLAVIEKIPTEWLPIRDGEGKIQTAKVTRQAAVDFVGVYHGRAVGFDVKATREPRVRWDRITPHQAQWLSQWQQAGGWAFVVVMDTSLAGLMWVVPWSWWTAGAQARSEGTGPASFILDNLPVEWGVTDRASVRGVPLDYLAVAERIFTAGAGPGGWSPVAAPRKRMENRC